MAHRGWAERAPENTLVSYRLAIATGARAVECDVALSKDQKAVLMHDDTLDRTTGRTGRVADLNAAELAKLDAGRWKSREFAGEPVPQLDQFLREVRGKAVPFVELKPGAGRPKEIAASVHASLVSAAFHPREVMLLSFGLPTLRAAQASMRPARTMFLVENTPTTTHRRDALLDSCLRNGFTAVGVENVGPSLRRTFFDAAHARGLSVYVWTVDDPEEIVRLARAGADSIGTNRPDVALRALRPIRPFLGSRASV